MMVRKLLAAGLTLAALLAPTTAARADDLTLPSLGNYAGRWVCNNVITRIGEDGAGVAILFKQPWLQPMKNKTTMADLVKNGASSVAWLKLGGDPAPSRLGFALNAQVIKAAGSPWLGSSPQVTLASDGLSMMIAGSVAPIGLSAVDPAAGDDAVAASPTFGSCSPSNLGRLAGVCCVEGPKVGLTTADLPGYTAASQQDDLQTTTRRIFRQSFYLPGAGGPGYSDRGGAGLSIHWSPKAEQAAEEMAGVKRSFNPQGGWHALPSPGLGDDSIAGWQHLNRTVPYVSGYVRKANYVLEVTLQCVACDPSPGTVNMDVSQAQLDAATTTLFRLLRLVESKLETQLVVGS